MGRAPLDKPAPDGSWVLEGHDDSSSFSGEHSGDDLSLEREAVEQTTRRRKRGSGTNSSSSAYQTRGAGRRASANPYHEPQLVMPSLFKSSDSPSSKATARPSIQPRKRRESRHEQDFNRPLDSRSSRKQSKQPHEEEENFIVYVKLLWHELLHPSAKFAHSVLRLIWNILKPALALFAAIWVIFYLAHHLVTSTISRTLTPLCSLPGMAYFDLPFCLPSSGGPPQFDQLMTVQSAFEDVLSTSSGGVTLPLDMKRSESSIRDLKHVVQYSALPSRNELVFEFTGFIETARQAAADLTRFNSRIGRAVDNVISTNRWTLQVIDGVAERQGSTGAVQRLLAGTVLYPFQSLHTTESVLLEQYLRHTRTIEDQIAELILEAQALLGILQNLDDRLDVIHGITTRDGVSVQGSRDELFAQLWTRLGGNRSSKKKHDDQLHLLSQVGNYRKVAWEHVSGTVLKLQSIAAGLEDLRERVAAPDVLGPRDDVPLRIHIENIQLAVERLDERRSEARRLEGDQQRRVLDKSGQLLLA